MSKHCRTARAAYVLVLVTGFAASALVAGEAFACQIQDPGACLYQGFMPGLQRVSASGAQTVLDPRMGEWGHWAAGVRARFDGRVSVQPFDPAVDEPQPVTAGWAAGRFSLSAGRVDMPLTWRSRHRLGVPDADSQPALAALASYRLSTATSIDLAVARQGLMPLRPTLAADPLAGVPSGLRSGYDASRTLWSATLNTSRQIGAFGFGGRIGYLDFQEQFDPYLENGGSVGRVGADRGHSLRQAMVGLDASYGFGRNWQVHGAKVLRRDISRDESRVAGGFISGFGGLQSSDRDEREWAVGVRYYGWRNFALNVEYLRTSGRDQFPVESLSLIGRIGF